MSANLRLPNITAQDPGSQMEQMQSYLYQLVQELNWALRTVENGTASPAMAARQEKSSAGSVQTPAETFQSIKALIIKSADIVEVYTEKISQELKGEYVAVSTFGTYSEQTNQRIEANSTQIQQNYSNLQTLTTQVDGLESTVVGVNAYIRSGLLDYEPDGSPVYGIEVGQKTEINGVQTFNKYARFSAARLSFFDANDNEVAYISDYKLFITNVEVTGSYRIGHLVDTVQGDGSIVTKYSGGG